MTDTTLDLKHNTDEEQPISKLLNSRQEPTSDCEDPPCANDCGNDDDCDNCEQKQSDAEDGCDETQECQDDHDPDTDQGNCKEDQEDKEDTDDEDDGEDDEEEDEGDNEPTQDDEDPEHECNCADPNGDKNNDEDDSSSSSSEEDSSSEHCCSCADWSCECHRQRLCKHHQRPKRAAVVHVKQASISEQHAPEDGAASEQEAEEEAQA
jgi:hypothetical protein